MSRLLKILFFGLIVRPLVLIALGLNCRGRHHLPEQGPAVIAANHNSHLDALVLMSLYPLTQIHKVRPVAAADYFLKNPLLSWFVFHIIGIIPIDRSGNTDKNNVFRDCHTALDQGHILIIFPEGSRGEPEQLSRLKKGIFHLIDDRPDVAVTPVIMHGLGKALPKGAALFVPFNCDVIVGQPVAHAQTATEFVDNLSSTFEQLFHLCITRNEQ